MRQKTIIQVWGRNGIGKSETIKIAHQELIKKYLNPAHTYIHPFPPPNHDIRNVFITIKNFKIAIESMGDYLYAYGLNGRLDEYIKVHQVDILICASRIRNDVNYHIEHLASTYGYRVIKVAPYIDEYGHFNIDEVNLSAARQLVALFNDIITGKL